MRLLVHPGFHKTGTTSLQHTATANAAALDGRLTFLTTAHLMPATRAARQYSAQPSAARLARFGGLLAEALEEVGTEALLISSEDLCGHMPGRKTLRGYAAAPALMDMMAEVWTSLWGREADVTVWFTTRAPEAWLRSVWWQNLKALRLTDDLETYAQDMAPAADLDGVVTSCAKAIGGRARVLSDRIEDVGAGPLGPLARALELLEIDAEGLKVLPAKNLQPGGAAEELLALNRSDLDDDTLRERKRVLVEGWKKHGLYRGPRPGQSHDARGQTVSSAAQPVRTAAQSAAKGPAQ